MILEGHEQYHDAEVLCRVSRFTLRPHTPLAPDLQRHVRGLAVPDVRESHEDDLPPCLLAHVGDHRLHVRDGRRIEHAREVVDVAAGRGEGDLLQAKEERNKG